MWDMYGSPKRYTDEADLRFEAAGAYLGATYLLEAARTTRCGYALLIDIDHLLQEAEREVKSNVAPKHHEELFEFMTKSRHESRSTVNSIIMDLDGKVDSRTQCGIVVGMLIGNFSTYRTQWRRSIGE